MLLARAAERVHGDDAATWDSYMGEISRATSPGARDLDAHFETVARADALSHRRALMAEVKVADISKVWASWGK